MTDLSAPASPSLFVRGHCRSRVGGMTTPQQLSREAIDEFKAIYEEEFGKVLTDDEVQVIAMRLLRFFGMLNRSDADEGLK